MNLKIISFLLLPLAFQFINCEKTVTEPEREPEPEPCEGICGKALLQGHDFHEGISIYNKEANELTQTDSTGNFKFSLPENGIYTLIAAYAFFISDTIFVEISDSMVVESLEMSLVQYLKPRIVPDTTVFSIADTLKFTIEIQNLLDREVCGPERIREDQLWLRHVGDTTSIFSIPRAVRDLPRAVSYSPLETKILRFVWPVSAYNVPVGTYQAWLADRFTPILSHPFCPNVSLLGRSFGPAKGWATIKIE